MDEHATVHCSFCGKPPERVGQLIAGRGDVTICNECVMLCSDINEEYRSLPQIGRRAPSGAAPQPVGPFRRLMNTLRKVRESHF
ncbi:MAG TPA: ClpX C4-type zinc finger protein [Chloroflexota bacterium]|nr:ClpX C4-type zinc finger protein [Chloroflexota bacterium]